MRVLITGASGLLGGHLLESGLAEGRDMVALSRNIHPRSFLKRTEVPHRSIDLTQADPLPPEIMAGVDAVIHCAGLASSDAKQAARMHAVNVDGTRALVEAAERAGVSTWIQVSSIATLSDGTDETIIDETHLGRLRNTPYARTKYDAERYVAEHVRTMRTVFVHPCYMLGRWDARPSSGAIFLALRLGRMRHFVNRAKNFVAASDVAAGIWRALDSTATGHYVVGHENRAIAEFMAIARNALKLRWELTELSPEEVDEPGRLPATERAWIEEFCSSSAASSAKAQAELGYRPQRTIEHAVEETLRYFVDTKML